MTITRKIIYKYLKEYNLIFVIFLFVLIPSMANTENVTKNLQTTHSKNLIKDDQQIPRIEFYFIRHGETNWSLKRIHEGPLDLPLNKSGKQQVCNLCELIKNKFSTIKKAKIITSNLKRTLETARIISNKMNIPIIAKKNNLREYYHGDYRFLDHLQKPKDQEDRAEFQKRVIQSLIEVLKEHQKQEGSLIIVAHQGVFKSIRKLLCGKKEKLDFAGIAHFKPLKNTNSWQCEILNKE